MIRNLISIIVPVYNAESYLKKCIESLINQTYKNIEIILVDDGSKDNSFNIIKEYREEDKRIKVFTKENGGVSSARNLGIELAEGEFVGFVDADDWVDTNMYERLLANLKEKDADVSACGFAREYGETEKSKTVGNGKKIFSDNKEKILELLTDTRGKFYCFSWNKLYKRSIIGDIRYSEKVQMSEDYLFNWKIFKGVRSIIFTNDGYYHYRNENDSATRNCPFQNYTTAVKINIKILNDYTAKNFRVKSNIVEDGVKLCIAGSNAMVKQGFNQDSYFIYRKYLDNNLYYMKQKSLISQIYYSLLGSILKISFPLYKRISVLQTIPLNFYRRLRRVVSGE